jgi:hypothetical protein
MRRSARQSVGNRGKGIWHAGHRGHLLAESWSEAVHMSTRPHSRMKRVNGGIPRSAVQGLSHAK